MKQCSSRLKLQTMYPGVFFFSIMLMFGLIFFPASSLLAGQFPIPDSGQTKCYDDAGAEINPCPLPGEPFYGQDANYSINPRSYTKLDADGHDLPITATSWTMVRDNVTGLIWEVKTDDGSVHDKDNVYTWDDTKNFINNLNAGSFGGYSDWRMPTLQELASITKKDVYDPAIDRGYFPNTMSDNYWSSTTYVHTTELAWYVYFSHGNVDYNDKSNSYYVRAVRAGQSVTGSFDNLVINGDGTVTDQNTGLMWQQETGRDMNWQDALSYCESLSLGGYDDWRLPTVDEMISIVDYSSYFHAINTDFFSDTVSFYYWSSTTSANYTGLAWNVDFYRGRVSSSNKSNNSYYVRAVRAGQSSGAIVMPNDTDSDGVDDNADAFPNDPAASIDSDGDGYPDSWNAGYTQDDSTTGLKLDEYPNDSSKWENGNVTVKSLVGTWHYTYNESQCPDAGTVHGQISFEGENGHLSHITYTGKNIMYCNVVDAYKNENIDLRDEAISVESVDDELSNCKWIDDKTITCVNSSWGGKLTLTKDISSQNPEPPVMSYQTNGTHLDVNWTGSSGADGYNLYYAPYPSANPIQHMDMESQTSLSTELPVGSAYYIAVTAYNNAGESGYSNVALFTIVLSDSEFSYVGNYSGSFSGDDYGTWSVVISDDGAITGSAQSNIVGTILVSGKVDNDGNAIFGGATNYGTNLSYKGLFSTNGVLSGSWITTLGNQGIFKGNLTQ